MGFVQEFIAGNLKCNKLPTPLFQPPPPPPYTQEDMTKLLVLGIVVTVVVVALGWSYVVFQQEAAIKRSQKQVECSKEEEAGCQRQGRRLPSWRRLVVITK